MHFKTLIKNRSNWSVRRIPFSLNDFYIALVLKVVPLKMHIPLTLS